MSFSFSFASFVRFNLCRNSQLAIEHKIKFMETSAKNSINVEEAFFMLSRDIKNKLEHKLVGKSRAFFVTIIFNLVFDLIGFFLFHIFFDSISISIFRFDRRSV